MLDKHNPLVSRMLVAFYGDMKTVEINKRLREHTANLIGVLIGSYVSEDKNSQTGLVINSWNDVVNTNRGRSMVEYQITAEVYHEGAKATD